MPNTVIIAPPAVIPSMIKELSKDHRTAKPAPNRLIANKLDWPRLVATSADVMTVYLTTKTHSRGKDRIA